MFKYSKTSLSRFFHVLSQKVKNPLQLKPSLKLTSVLLIPLFLLSCTKSHTPGPGPGPEAPSGNGTFLYHVDASGNDIKIGECLEGDDFDAVIDPKTFKYLFVKSPDGYITRVTYGHKGGTTYAAAFHKNFHTSQKILTDDDALGFSKDAFTDEELAIIQPFLNYYKKPLFMTVAENHSDSVPRTPFFLLIDLTNSVTFTDGFEINDFDDWSEYRDEKYSARVYSDGEPLTASADFSPATIVDEKAFTDQFPIGWKTSGTYTIKDENGNVLQQWPLDPAS